MENEQAERSVLALSYNQIEGYSLGLWDHHLSYFEALALILELSIRIGRFPHVRSYVPIHCEPRNLLDSMFYALSVILQGIDFNIP